jgi:hypothetical protein
MHLLRLSDFQIDLVMKFPEFFSSLRDIISGASKGIANSIELVFNGIVRSSLVDDQED